MTDAAIAPEENVPSIVGVISLDKIFESKVALRAVDRQSEKYLQLVDSVRAKGILNPVVVREIKDANGNLAYGLVDGLHRWTAAKDAGLKDIPARITRLDDRELLEAQIIANLHRVDTKPVEYTKQLMRILSGNPLMTREDLAASINQSVAWISQRLNLLNLTDPIQQLVDEGKINVSNAYALSKLPPDEQADFVDRAITDSPQIFMPTVAARAKEIRDAKLKGKDKSPAEFQPTAHLQKVPDIKKEFETPTELTEMILKSMNVTDMVSAFRAGLAWVLHLDPLSVRAAKAEYDARKAKREEEAAKRKAERDEKKKQEAASDQADIQNWMKV
jgi:ParB/RepB/Spo0J family partition protein